MFFDSAYIYGANFIVVFLGGSMEPPWAPTGVKVLGHFLSVNMFDPPSKQIKTFKIKCLIQFSKHLKTFVKKVLLCRLFQSFLNIFSFIFIQRPI